MNQQMPPGGPGEFGASAGGPPPLPGLPPMMSGMVLVPRYQPMVGPPFGVGEVLSAAWRTLFSQPGTLIGASLLYMLIAVAASFIPIIGGLTSIFLGPLYVATVYLFVRAARSQPVHVGDMFQIFGPRYWPLLVIYLLFTIAIVAAGIPTIIAVVAGVMVGIAGNGSSGAMTVAFIVGGVGVLLGVVLSMFVTMRLWFATTLYLDAPVGSLDIIEALKMSWRSTARSWPTLVAAQLIMVVIVVLSFLMLVVPFFIIGLPLAFAFLGAAHAMLFPLMDQRRCVQCGYELGGVLVGGACPECGTIRGTV